MSSPQIETLDATTATMTLSLEAGLYPIDVLYGAAFVFIDRAYVLLDRHIDAKDGKSARYIVHLRGKGKLSEAQLRDIAGEFGNELLSQALRRKVVATVDDAIDEAAADVTAVLHDGRRVHVFVEHAIGSLQRPMTDAMLEGKFHGMGDSVLGAQRISALIAAAWGIGNAPDVGALVALARP